MLTSFALTTLNGRRRAKSTQISPENWAPNFQNTGLEIEPRFPAKPLRRKSVPNLGRSWREIEPATFRLQACVAPPTRPNSSGQHGHTSSFATMAIAPGPGPTKSKIQNPNSKRLVWILDFGFWISDFGFLDFWIYFFDFGISDFWILDFGFRILDFGFWISDFGFWILDFGFVDFGFWILDFGFWISLVFVLFVAAPNGPVWILDFGFRISDFGFWILDFGFRNFGFWILDFGFWISDFGFWILG